MFDTHCHLNFKAFKKSLPDVILRAQEAGITHIVIPGTDVKTSKKGVDVAQLHDNMYAAVGIHPHHAYKLVKREEIREKSEEKKLKPYEDPTLKIFDTEEKFYGYLGLPYIPPEIREGTTEIQAAIKNQIPKLIELKDIKGDFHMHTSFDIKTSHDVGLNSVEELVEKAKNLGYSYIGFSDHNPKMSGLSAKEASDILKERKLYFDQVLTNSSIPHFIGLEVDIMPSGELAFPEDALDYVDYLIVSLHSSLRMDIDTMTDRVLKALSYPKVKIFGHPTGRLLGKRDGADIRWEKIIPFVSEHNIALEVNSSPSRLDLPDVLVREAKEQGAKFFINTDAHAVEHMDFMKYGVYVARRGWLTKEDVINSGSIKDIKNWFEL